LRKVFIAALAVAAATGAAFAADGKKDAKAGCEPAPKELVTKDLKEGDGAAAQVHTPVLMSYTGWLYDACAPEHKGEMFDTSAKRPPFGFIVGAGRVIKGWDEGVAGMKEHGKRLLVIPPDKAYGERGAGNGKIPPGATLVFEVELMKVLGTGPGMQSTQVPKQ